ncbi:universal stress protein [Aquimarina sp. TRL1]|nr:universal stress protein [Aquimarina sp. TRL1]QKX07575.1 universal stress protein [Aquimarina sp. TRL1]
MERILVPTDFSPQAESALKVAAQVAKKNNAEIYLLHIIDLPDYSNDLVISGNSAPAPPAILFMQQTHLKYEEYKDKDYLEGITVKETVSFEGMQKGVSDTCTNNDIDLIIMGSNGASGVKELFIGSNSEKIVRFSKIPVLVIKNECDLFNIKNFVYASSFEEEDKLTLLAAYNFSKEIDATFNLVWINTSSKFRTTHYIEHKMNSLLSTLPIEDYTLNIYNDETIEKGIMNFANTIKAGIIGMGTHGRTGISHFVNGSISEDMVNHAKRPVITFRIPAN